MADDTIFQEHLRSMRTQLAHLANHMGTISTEMRATRQHVAGLVALQDHDHIEIAQIKLRLERIERRLNLID